jgi:hypothetical protein
MHYLVFVGYVIVFVSYITHAVQQFARLQYVNTLSTLHRHLKMWWLASKEFPKH